MIASIVGFVHEAVNPLSSCISAKSNNASIMGKSNRIKFQLHVHVHGSNMKIQNRDDAHTCTNVANMIKIQLHLKN